MRGKKGYHSQLHIRVPTFPLSTPPPRFSSDVSAISDVMHAWWCVVFAHICICSGIRITCEVDRAFSNMFAAITANLKLYRF